MSFQTWAQAKIERDPTTPLSYKQSSRSQNIRLELQAIYTAANGHSAIINGKSLKEGQSIAGWKVENIRANAVTVASASGSKVLRLHQTVVKTNN